MNYDILNISVKSEAVTVENSVVCSIKKSNIEKIGFRRFENGKIFQTSKVGTANLDQLMSDSKKWGGQGLPINYPFAQAVKDKKLDTVSYRHKLEEFKQGLDLLKERYPQFLFKGSCEINQTRTIFTSSYGVDLESEGSKLIWYFIIQKKGSGNAFDGVFQGHGIACDIQSILNQGMLYLDVFDQTVDIKDGKYPVIIADEDSQMGPFSKLSESFVSNKYHDGAALFSTQLGQKLFSEKITLCDQGYNMKKNHPEFFDGEGVVRTTNLVMIDQGVFKNLFYDLRFADKYKAKTTGNGLRPYNQGVMLAPRDLYFKPGKKSWKEIIKDHDRCIVVNIAAGGDGNDLGEYSTPVQASYVYEKGELIGRAPQITIKTSVKRGLNEDLIDVSSDGLASTDQGKGLVISMMDVFNN